MKNVLGGSLLAVLLCSTSSLAGAPAASAATPAPANLSSEQATLDHYANDLASFYKQSADLNKAPENTAAEVEALRSKAKQLQSQAGGAQSAIASVLRKLKASGEFTGLDAKLAEQISDSQQKNVLLATSFQSLLESSATGLTSKASELAIPVDRLAGRLTGKAPTGAVPFTLACRVQTVRSNLIVRLGGSLTNSTLDQLSCACNPGPNAVGIGTGASCASVR
jgi:hypothetical protein